MIANDKVKRPERVIQFGEGGFLRGFVDWILQIVNEKTEFDGSVVVVQPIAKGMCQMLQEQDCVYTHIMRGIKNGVPTVEKKKIDVISRTVNPYEDWQSYLQLAENPDFRIVVSNTTESGIAIRRWGYASRCAPEFFSGKADSAAVSSVQFGIARFYFSSLRAD